MHFATIFNLCTLNEFINFHGNCIRCDSCACHLGNYIESDMERKNILNSVNEFVCNINTIKASFSYADVEILYKLLKSYCMPLYGCVLWDFSKKDVIKFFTTWRKCVRHLLNLPQRTHSRLLPQIVGDKPIEVQLHNRVVKFLASMYESDNSLLKLSVKLCLQGSCSSACNSYVHIKDKYKLRNGLSDYRKIVNTKHQIGNSDEFLVGHIKDLLCMRESPRYSILSSGEIRGLLEYFCCCATSDI